MKTVHSLHECLTCGKTFNRRDSLRRHKAIHTGKVVPCPKCDSKFRRIDNMKRHLRTQHTIAQPTNGTDRPQTSSDSTPPSVNRKDTSGPQLPPQPTSSNGGPENQPGCSHWPDPPPIAPTHLIATSSKPQSTDELPSAPVHHAPDPLAEDPEVFPADIDVDDDDEFARVFKDNWAAIRTHHLVGRAIQDIYNVHMNTQGASFELTMNEIFKKLTCRAKINLSCGFILRHIETGELRYFHPSHNNASLLPVPFTIACREDMDIVIRELEASDILEHARQQRPDTKWSVVSLTNIAVYVNKMPQFFIGTPPPNFPDVVKNNRGLYSLTHNIDNGQRYDDNLCFFRCVALH